MMHGLFGELFHYKSPMDIEVEDGLKRQWKIYRSKWGVLFGCWGLRGGRVEAEEITRAADMIWETSATHTRCLNQPLLRYQRWKH